LAKTSTWDCIVRFETPETSFNLEVNVGMRIGSTRGLSFRC